MLLHCPVGPEVSSCAPALTVPCVWSSFTLPVVTSSISPPPVKFQSTAKEYCIAATTPPVTRRCVSRQKRFPCLPTAYRSAMFMPPIYATLSSITTILRWLRQLIRVPSHGNVTLKNGVTDTPPRRMRFEKCVGCAEGTHVVVDHPHSHAGSGAFDEYVGYFVAGVVVFLLYSIGS